MLLQQTNREDYQCSMKQEQYYIELPFVVAWVLLVIVVNLISVFFLHIFKYTANNEVEQEKY